VVVELMALSLKLPVRTREVFAGDHSREETQTVFCSHRNESTSVDECRVCPFARSVEKDAVVCVRGQPPTVESFPIGHDPRVDIAAAAARTLLHEIIPADTTCIRADLSVEAAAALLVERGLRCLPVIDSDERLIGIISKSDLLRDDVDGDEPPTRVRIDRGFHVEPLPARTVAEVMTASVHALPENAPVGFAISLMAFESLHEVPIVSEDGRVVGVATALDLLRWLAARMGYVLAAPGPLASA
jgi:CBS domain-containing protein